MFVVTDKLMDICLSEATFAAENTLELQIAPWSWQLSHHHSTHHTATSSVQWHRREHCQCGHQSSCPPGPQSTVWWRWWWRSWRVPFSLYWQHDLVWRQVILKRVTIKIVVQLKKKDPIKIVVQLKEKKNQSGPIHPEPTQKHHLLD